MHHHTLTTYETSIGGLLERREMRERGREGEMIMSNSNSSVTAVQCTCTYLQLLVQPIHTYYLSVAKIEC